MAHARAQADDVGSRMSVLAVAWCAVCAAAADCARAGSHCCVLVIVHRTPFDEHAVPRLDVTWEALAQPSSCVTGITFRLGFAA